MVEIYNRNRIPQSATDLCREASTFGTLERSQCTISIDELKRSFSLIDGDSISADVMAMNCYAVSVPERSTLVSIPSARVVITVPYSLQCVTEDENSIRISWLDNNSIDSVTYEIEYRRTGSRTWLRQSHNDRTRTVDVFGLDEGAEYEF